MNPKQSEHLVQLFGEGDLVAVRWGEGSGLSTMRQLRETGPAPDDPAMAWPPRRRRRVA
jgi:hypothetical protein